MAGDLYYAFHPGDPELTNERAAARVLIREFNAEADDAARLGLLRRLLGGFDEAAPPFIEPPLRCDYVGGKRGAGGGRWGLVSRDAGGRGTLQGGAAKGAWLGEPPPHDPDPASHGHSIAAGQPSPHTVHQRPRTASRRRRPLLMAPRTPNPLRRPPARPALTRCN